MGLAALGGCHLDLSAGLKRLEEGTQAKPPASVFEGDRPEEVAGGSQPFLLVCGHSGPSLGASPPESASTSHLMAGSL
jgi:hypothetical protein